MSEKQTTPHPKPASAATSAKKVSDGGKAEIQAMWDEANAKGYFGETPDETPNEAYTVAGVTKAAKESKT